MSSPRFAPLLAVSILALAACGGGSGGGSTGPVERGSLSIGTDGLVDQSRASVSRADDGRILLRITEGPMQNTTVLCEDQTLGACSVVGGPTGTSGQGTLLQRLEGDYAFVGNFSILQLIGGTSQTISQFAHSERPGTPPARVRLPREGVANYAGRFSGSAGVSGRSAEMVEGDMSLLVDFNQAVLSGRMNADLSDGQPVSAAFNNVTVNASNGEFEATRDTLFLFQEQPARGEMSGAFYGPGAQEAAGVFNLGNPQGNMSGIFLACQGSEASCIRE